MNRKDLEEQFKSYDNQKGFVSRWMQKLFGFETNPRIRWMKRFVRSQDAYGDKFVIRYKKFESYIKKKMKSSWFIKRFFSKARVAKDKPYTVIIQKWIADSEKFEKNLVDYPASRTSYDDETELDFKTESDPNNRLTAREIFPGSSDCSVNLYRNQVFSTIESVDGVGVIAKSHQEPIEKSLVSVPEVPVFVTKNTMSNGYYYGRVDLKLKTDCWQPLPSLSANDKLTGLNSSEPIKIKYSRVTNLYYLRLLDDDADGKVSIEFNVNVKSKPKFLKKTKVSKRKQKLLAKILEGLEGNNNDKSSLEKLKKKLSQKELAFALTNYCRDFTPGELTDDVKNSITKIIKEQKGVCRHRAIAYMYLASKLGVPCRLIQNDVQQYVEIKLNNEWVSIDLGGEKCDLNIVKIQDNVIDLQMTSLDFRPSAIVERYQQESFQGLSKSLEQLSVVNSKNNLDVENYSGQLGVNVN